MKLGDPDTMTVGGFDGFLNYTISNGGYTKWTNIESFCQIICFILSNAVIFRLHFVGCKLYSGI